MTAIAFDDIDAINAQASEEYGEWGDELVVTQEMINRLKPGMTRRQVRFILGEPVLANAFREDRWDYVYTIQIGSLDRLQQGLTVYFEDDALSYFEGDFLPSAVKEAQEKATEQAAEAAAAAGA